MALLGEHTQVLGPLPTGTLLLETLVGVEELGAPYAFELGLLSRDPSLDPALVMGQPLAVGIRGQLGEWRYFHGIVDRFSKSGEARRHTRYAARLVPQLALLGHTRECRAFEKAGQTALGIVSQVLAERGGVEVASGAVTDHPFRARELCVQYRESDLCFVQRLLEEEGIYYFFRHEPGRHTMVLANGVAAHAEAPGYLAVPYVPEPQQAAGSAEHFWGMAVRQGIFPGRHTVLAGYDPTKLRPRQPVFGAERSTAPGSQLEHYDYPGGLFDPDEAADEAARRVQAGTAEQTVIEVEGNTRGIGVGELLRVRPGLGEELSAFWSADGFAKQYLVARASYVLSVHQHEEKSVAGLAGDDGFRARYWLLDSQTPFRPRRTVRKPEMGGPQTALVVGPVGKEVWTDKLGRIWLQFDWDREASQRGRSTAWVRVAQTWSGAGFGGMHLPRVGQEVIVRFLDGDPDRPIVCGALYSADNQPPHALPANQAQSGWKSRSSKGGTPDNFNEIRFDDKLGAEELHVQAERDMSTLVKHCQRLDVGRDRAIIVGKDEKNLVRAERELTVDGKDSVVVGGDHDKTVNGTVLQVCGGDHSRKVEGEQELVAEQNKDEHVRQAHTLTTDKKFQLVQGETSMTFKQRNVTLDAAGEIVVLTGGATVSMEANGRTTFDSPTGITLTCGASSLAVTPGGVAIAAPAITAAAGASTMALGAEQAAIKSRKVTIEATGVCKVWGHKKLKLQEAEKVKGRKAGGGGTLQQDATTKPKAGKAVQAQEGSWAFDLWIRLDIDPTDASERADAFCLASTDGAVAVTKTIAEDQVPNDKSIDLLFPNLDGEKSYTLKIRHGEGEYVAFENVSGRELHHIHDDDEQEATGDDVETSESGG